MDGETRAYYRRTWGWDPRPAPVVWPDGGHAWKYEEAVPLPADPLLSAVGASVAARVEFRRGRRTVAKNFVVFGWGRFEAAVSCVHTKVRKVPVDDLPSDPAALAAVLAKAGTEEVGWLRGEVLEAASLSPEEHFVALKSFVEGLASAGLLQARSPRLRLRVREAPVESSGEAGADRAVPWFAVDPHLLYQLAAALDSLLARAAAEHYKPGVLAALSEDHDEAVRAAVGANPRAPAQVLRKLAGDPRARVRVAVATNPSAEGEVLTMLAADPRVEVVRAVAANRGTPGGTLSKLSTALDVATRLAVVDNPSTPPEARLLAELVQRFLEGGETTPEEERRMVERGPPWLRGLVALRARDPALLRVLAADPDASVREALALNPRSN
ncbi:MAG: hypothetical protein Kow0069_23980 [Promethearchaeota archaeon]